MVYLCDFEDHVQALCIPLADLLFKRLSQTLEVAVHLEPEVLDQLILILLCRVKTSHLILFLEICYVGSDPLSQGLMICLLRYYF